MTEVARSMSRIDTKKLTKLIEKRHGSLRHAASRIKGIHGRPMNVSTLSLLLRDETNHFREARHLIREFSRLLGKSEREILKLTGFLK